MPAITDIIDTVSTPPLAALQQVLDTGGPYSGGDHVLSTFHTNGAFVLPSGTYQVNGTYGVLVVASTIPIAAGHVVGFNGIIGGQDKDEDTYLDRIAQIVVYHSLPITGLYVATQRYDVHHTFDLNLWQPYLLTGSVIGLHVQPGFAVDLYYLCVL